jgi:diguanylate cyclase (GGDEF)-like protein
MSTQADCPLPENEGPRLKAVLSYDILDTPPEVDFDALTRIASQSLNTPAAVVGLMDSDRLWFKSRLGLDVPQVERKIAVCAYAVMTPQELLIVEDLSLDSRFQDNPLVSAPPHIRFYAGAPLVDPNGLALGTLAVVDTKPRKLTPGQGELLRDLAILAMTALENRKRANLLADLAMTDYLTGLANRALFDRALKSEMAHAKRTGETFALLYMDLDGFKDINDRLGHTAGDEVLCEVARRLKQELRSEDIAARIGGDEFGVIMRNASVRLAHALAQRISQAIHQPMTISNGEQVGVGISTGLVGYTDDIDSTITMLAQADSALYQAKRQQRSR